MVMLRRAYEYVLVMAALEGVRPVRRPYYEGYVDALDILGARAVLIAKSPVKTIDVGESVDER